MVTAQEQRHIDISNLEKGSFQAAHGYEDIQALIQAVYTHADQLGIFRVVCLDADLAGYAIAREVTRAAPDEPGPGATQNQLKAYEMQRRLFERQDDGLRSLKKDFLAALDRTATGKITQPNFGTMRVSILQGLTTLKTEFGTMTHKELGELQHAWRAGRWDAATDLCDFMENFRTQVAFLTEHNFEPPVGEQVMTLLAAVQHEAAFSNMANAAFHAAHPQPADQTLARLITVYTTVYRGQYEHVTAREHHYTANEVKATDPHADTMQYLAASVRGSLEGHTVTHAQRMALADALAKTVVSIMHPQLVPPRTTRRPPAATSTPMVNIPGVCTHPSHNSAKISHLWKDCRLNPNSPNFTPK